MKGSKTSMPLKYRHLAKVTVPRFHSFPLDMLRYDNCHPYQEVDSSALAETLTGRQEPQVIVIEQFSERATSHWTVDRWKSFGGGITIESIDQSEVYRLRDKVEAEMKAQKG